MNIVKLYVKVLYRTFDSGCVYVFSVKSIHTRNSFRVSLHSMSSNKMPNTRISITIFMQKLNFFLASPRNTWNNLFKSRWNCLSFKISPVPYIELLYLMCRVARHVLSEFFDGFFCNLIIRYCNSYTFNFALITLL